MTYRAALILALMLAWPSHAAPKHVLASLVADTTGVAPGQSFRAGVLFTIPPRSHIYWINPGDSGLPTSIEWRLPLGFEAGELQWPYPTAIHDDVLDETYFAYEREVLLFSIVRPPKDIPEGASTRIEARAEWLVCLEDGACIPERADLALDLPAAHSSIPSVAAKTFETYTQRTPLTPEDSKIPIVTEIGDAGSVLVRFGAGWRLDSAQRGAATFFPLTGSAWTLREPEAPAGQTLRFIPPAGPIDGPPAGAVRLSVVSKDSTQPVWIYVRMGEWPGADPR